MNQKLNEIESGEKAQLKKESNDMESSTQAAGTGGKGKGGDLFYILLNDGLRTHTDVGTFVD